MKKLIFAALFIAATFNASAQVKQDKAGNYYTSPTGRTKQDTTNTGHTFTDAKGNKYQVFQSASGKLFVPRISKQTGRYYRQYLKLN
jgi:hypothetical protein